MPPVTVMAVPLNGTPTSPVVTDEHTALSAALIVITQPLDDTPFASVTFTLKVPEAVGVPVTAPFDAFSVKPAGRVPLIEYVYGAVPPVTVIAVPLNGTPTSPVVTDEHTALSAALIVITQPLEDTPFASVTFTLKVPEAVGVPVTAPFDAFSVKPAGNVPLIE